MDITVYDEIYKSLEKSLKTFNEGSGFGVQICPYAPNKPQFPLVVLTEVRNQPTTRFYSGRERLSSLGYRVDIFSKETILKEVKSNGSTCKRVLDKQEVCRIIMQFVVEFFQNNFGMNLISNNSFDREGTQGELYRITLVFRKNYFENRRYFF